MANMLWNLTHPRSWPTTNATVDSCEWVQYHEHLGGTSGHFQVRFSYQAPGGRVNHGDFCHQGSKHIAPYRTGEQLAIQYDPKKPARFHFSGAPANYEKLEAIVVVTVFALLAGYVLYTF